MYLEVKDLKKSYGEGGGYVQVLKGITKLTALVYRTWGFRRNV